jgi:hypothetical protein
MKSCSWASLAIGCLLAATSMAHAEFTDNFDKKSTGDWQLLVGDGEAKLSFVPMKGFARMKVDATRDKHNIWWTVIKRNIAQHLDLEKLQDPAYELRVEARVRPSHAPRRVNFMINTQRTTDFHEHLREYELRSTDEWQVISMTTRNLDVKPGDDVNVQLGVTDWGPGEYYLDVDYYRAQVVRRDQAEADLGEPLIYHPPIPPLDSFQHHLAVSQDAVINEVFPEVNFHQWQSNGKRVLTATAGQYALLRWDLKKFKGQKADGAGVLSLTTESLQAGGNYVQAYGEDLGIEFGKLRVFEIFGGDENWQQESVSLQSFTQGKPLQSLINGQMVFDTDIAAAGEQTLVTLPRPVIQRLLDGTTKGLLLRPLGALSLSIYDSEEGDGQLAPKLYFNSR